MRPRTRGRVRVGAAAALLCGALAGCAAGPRAVPVVPPGLAEGEHTATINGARLWYRVAGDGEPGVPPVVFLHGGPGYNSHSFARFAGPHLERGLRMVYFDQRGSGRSERPAGGDYALSTLVEDVEGLRRELGVPRIAVLGHSFGAVLGLEYAARYPQNVSHVVVASGLWDAPMQCRLRREWMAANYPEVWARIGADTLDDAGARRGDCALEMAGFRGAEREAYQARTMFPDTALRLRQERVDEESGLRNTGELGGALFRSGLMQYRFTAHDRLTMPVLVLAGAHDFAAHAAGLRTLADRLPRARYVELPRGGHFMYLEEPERFASVVTEFVNGR